MLCLNPLVPDKRVKVQQRGIFELDGQLEWKLNGVYTGVPTWKGSWAMVQCCLVKVD